MLATSPAIAEDALEAIDVDIEQLAPVPDRLASAQDRSLLFEEKGTNLAIKFHALRGDAELFAREDAVEAAWRVVDPILDTATPVHLYELQTWGPPEADRLIARGGRWHTPAPAEPPR